MGLETLRGNRRKRHGSEVLGGKHGQRAGIRAGAGKEGRVSVGHMGNAESQPGVGLEANKEGCILVSEC